MHTMTIARVTSVGGLTALLLFTAQVASSWTGPTLTAPNGNVSAPINTGTTDQVKNAGLSVNSLAVYGNAILSGTSNYLNFGTTAGTSGYGIRNTSGTLEFKNSGGSWESLSTIINNYIALAGQWTTSGSDIYRSAGSVGIGISSPQKKLHISDAAAGQIRMSYSVDNTYYREIGRDNSSTGVFFIKRAQGGAAVQDFTIDVSGNVGIGTATPAQKLDVSGSVIATAYLYSSDARLKSDVLALSHGLDTLMRLRPVSYIWNEGTPRAGEKDMGFIAQEVRDVLPHIVETSPDGSLSVDYVRVVPFLVAAIQEQQAQIDTLRAELDAVKAR